MSNILVVEDEAHLAEGLRFNLEAEGYQVNVVDTGEAALELFHGKKPDYDVVVLDVMLPGKDGFEVISELRQAGQFVPTLMLTARGRPEDVLKGFAAGADDYLTKPFELSILFARIRGLLRRRRWLETAIAPPTATPGSSPVGSAIGPEVAPSNAIRPEGVTLDVASPNSNRSPLSDRFVFGDKSVEFDALELHVREHVFPLTLMETNVLRYLIQHEGKPVSRRQMLEEVWGLHVDTDTRPIDNFIVRLRRYLEDDPTNPKHLLTVRGVGYRFVASAREG
jgi:DNA-binding response OmpR family regulator